MREIELLSPARDVNTAESAILCGADAVYIGADAFGARAAAANSVEDIARLCEFAHLYGCKVYVALNTILTDAEVEEAAKLAKKLADAKVDALIVQDMGLLEAGLPLPVHASTQCHIDTPAKAAFLSECGFDTLVLARELSLGEISEIAKASGARIECFAHGALCVSYSGQCALSYAVGGRSGNRGECAQPCRMKYELLDADFKPVAPPAHYLSLRDMNRSGSLGEMMDAGVSSFKIEGRLKDAGYVKNTTALYRRMLDAEIKKRGLKKSSFGDSEIGFSPDAAKSFSRTFCECRLHSSDEPCESFATPKARGEFLGEAKRTFRGGFFFENAQCAFSNGDGLAFEFGGETFGASVRKIDGDKVFIGRPDDDFAIPPRAKIFRNRNAAFEAELEKKCVRTMPVNVTAREDGEFFNFSMSLCDSRGAHAEISLKKSEFETAKNADAARASLAENLSKLGGTPFRTSCVKIDFKNAPFMRASEINSVRRELSELLKADILRRADAARPAPAPHAPAKTYSEAPFETDARANVLNSYAKKFYRDRGINISEDAFESGKVSLRDRRVMLTKHCVLRELGMCKKKAAPRFREPLYLRTDGALLRLKFDCARCACEIFFEPY